MFNQNHLIKAFNKMGADIYFDSSRIRANTAITFNVRNNKKKGEHFLSVLHTKPSEFDVKIIDTKPDIRQLLLMIESAENKIKLLTGHDERHWYVANVKSDVRNIYDAFESLKPIQVRNRQTGMNIIERNSRHNNAFIRQGEWFFIPVDPPVYKDEEILKNEPIQRPNGSPHIVEELLRFGGKNVYIGPNAANGVSYAQMLTLISKHGYKQFQFRQRRLGARVFARGKIRHRDHKTIKLCGWHEVFLSTEARSDANMFLD